MTNKAQQDNFSLRWKGDQRRIGITGGIATGKTTIGNFLKEHQKWPILDTDRYAKEALKPHTVYTQEVLKRYGSQIICLNNKQEINRKLLAKIIFKDKEERLWLESLIHPAINSQLQKNLELQKKSPVIVIIIPLLFEVGLHSICSEVWFVDCTVDKQLKRLMNRNEISRSEAQTMINAQWSSAKKKSFADLIINNNADGFETWRKQVTNFI